MATKTIVSETHTIHVPGPEYKPVQVSEASGRLIPGVGKYDIIEVKPRTPVEIDSKEADRLINRNIAHIYIETVVEAIKPVVAVKSTLSMPNK